MEKTKKLALDCLNKLNAEKTGAALTALKNLEQSPAGFGNFTALLGLEIVSYRDGRAHARLEIKEHLLNRIHILHGGAAYALADVTTAMAGLSLLDPNQKIVTQDLHYRYHGAVKAGWINAHAEVIHFGTRTVVVTAKIYSGETLIGSADGTFALVTQEELER